MKVIDLLNKIANGEEVPKKIKYDTREMKYDLNKQDYLGYYSNGNGEWLFQYLFDRCRNTEHFINDEIEIIEEPKKIEKLHIEYEPSSKEHCEKISSIPDEISVVLKLNEIIEKINNME